MWPGIRTSFDRDDEPTGKMRTQLREELINAGTENYLINYCTVNLTESRSIRAYHKKLVRAYISMRAKEKIKQIKQQRKRRLERLQMKNKGSKKQEEPQPMLNQEREINPGVQ